MLSTAQSLRPNSINISRDIQSLSQAAGSLVCLGSEVFSKANLEDEAFTIFDAAHTIATTPPSVNIWTVAQKHLELGCKLIADMGLSLPSNNNSSSLEQSPDLYQEDECDVGARCLKSPVAADNIIVDNMALLEAVILYNKALIYHSKGNAAEAKRFYELASLSVQTILGFFAVIPSVNFMELSMRVHNNLGLIHYNERNESLAGACFETALHFAKHLADLTKAHRLEYATVLSNFCRVNWMRGDISDSLYKQLKEILRIRSTLLSWDHPDVAASHYNLAVADYARQDCKRAESHLMEYMAIYKYHSKEWDASSGLDAIPALIYLLLIQNEEKEDHNSQELVRGLRTLQEKRQDQGPESPEVASVLNFVGTLLFHKQDFDNALVFFREELRLEDNNEYLFVEDFTNEGTTSVSVTCNNIGRILQELGRFHEAIHFYERALKHEYGDVSHLVHSSQKDGSEVVSRICSLGTSSNIPTASANLYSTVWYNLGLIHDKLGSYEEAIASFKMSLELRETMLGPEHPDIACLLYNIGVLQMEQEHLGDASASFRKALRIRHSGIVGQLCDRHVLKTLEKLASLHKTKGDIGKALDTYKEILQIQEVSNEIEARARSKAIGTTMRSISELYHAKSDMAAAIATATRSVESLRTAVQADCREEPMDRFDMHSQIQEYLLLDRIANIEQLTSSLLLLGSLYHEECEPLKAEVILTEAARIVSGTRATAEKCIGHATPSSLYALQEVTAMLANNHCAPEA